ncbi:amino acid permease/ SLC12A domain-containing protein [Leucosporidium creatinivorum]|uniref:Amino acid permease/ SLC12A domain-containing protein n=1 Tax=Leucosporidium creatinivorum TaxID=106004 RepID=A0A1Y2EPA7_9BASI|nr:amino acid permease/ SLC12A domain-containing protein [Leucosporidium creatinivorum]
MSLSKPPSSTEDEKKDDTRAYIDAASIHEGKKEGVLRYSSTSAAHRKFEPYHVNLIALGGTVGTSLFIYMGSGLTQGGPANLLMGYAFWTSVIWSVAEIQKEMVTVWPTDCAFSRNAGRYVDDAMGFAMAWNFFISQIALVLFEVVAFGVVIGYWDAASNVNIAVYITIVIALYCALNLWDARFYANAEFAAAMGKVLLIIGLLLFTFISMVGGNPQHKVFGFTYWNNPGAMTTPYPSHEPTLGRFEGFFACVINACFTIAGPDYLSMVAGEARHPRKTMPKAFDQTIYRLVFFYFGSAIAIGILCPYNDPNLLGAIAAGAPGAATSPYVIAMQRMSIPALPSIVNALILSSVLSAGNAFVFCSSRSLAMMARDGQAPKIFSKRNKRGVPYLAVSLCLAIALLSYLQVSSSASVFITYLTGLVGSAQLVTWFGMSFTWIRWNAAYKAQGISRETLPVRSRVAPYCAWYAFICVIIVTTLQGYPVFLEGKWDVSTFIFSYAMPILFPIFFLFWKLVKRTKWETSLSADITSFVDDPEFTEIQHYEDEETRGAVSAFSHKVLSTLF